MCLEAKASITTYTVIPQNSPQKPKYTNLEQKLFIKSLDKSQTQEFPSNTVSRARHCRKERVIYAPCFRQCSSCIQHEVRAAGFETTEVQLKSRFTQKHSLFSPTAKPYPETLRQIFKSHYYVPTYHQSRGTHAKRQNPA